MPTFVGYNSPGAWSSVNHFHFQGFFLSSVLSGVDAPVCANFPIVNQPRQELFRVGSSVVAHRMASWPITCYAVELTQESDSANRVAKTDFIETVWQLIRVLQRRKIPHNMLTVAKPTLVVWIFPRLPQQENGSRLFGQESDRVAPQGRLRVAIAEAAGLVIAGDEVAFSGLTEDMFVQILREEVSISPVRRQLWQVDSRCC